MNLRQWKMIWHRMEKQIVDPSISKEDKDKLKKLIALKSKQYES